MNIWAQLGPLSVRVLHALRPLPIALIQLHQPEALARNALRRRSARFLTYARHRRRRAPTLSPIGEQPNDNTR